MFGDAHANHFLGGIFLVLFSITFIILFGIFSSNCDSTVCTIPNTTMLQLTNIKYAIWVPIVSLLLIGVFMIAGARNNNFMIKNETFIGLWCNIFPVISLTLLVSSSLLYSVINADGFKCGDVNSPNSKTVYSDLHIQLFHYVTGMISMSAVLFCISVYVLYGFWKETDEQKIQKAKDAFARFEKITAFKADGLDNAKIISELPTLKKALEEGANLDPEKYLVYTGKIADIQTYLEKSEEIRKGNYNKLQEIELSKVTKSAEQNAQTLSAINAKTLLKDFDSIKDDNEKIKAICKYAKSDQQVYDALKQTEFYKTNSKKIDATCSGTLDAYTDKLAQEQRVKKYYNEFEIALKKGDPVDILGSLDKVCGLQIKDSYKDQILEKIVGDYGKTITGYGVDIRQVCGISGIPGTSSTRRLQELIETFHKKSASSKAPPVQAPSPAQAPAVSTNCSSLASQTVKSYDPTRYICGSLDDKDNTGMSDEDIFNCLRQNNLINDKKTLSDLRLDCNVLSGPKIKDPGIHFKSKKDATKLFEEAVQKLTPVQSSRALAQE